MKINLDTPYDSDNFDYSSINESENLNTTFNPDDPFDTASISKNYSTSSSLKQYIEGIDDNSDTEQDRTQEQEKDVEAGNPDPISRPWSRNSTTSCLSTTATKDGVEGKRFHRHGPTAYSTNILANMVHQQQLQYLQQQQQAQSQQQQYYEKSSPTSTSPFNPTPVGTPLRSNTATVDHNASQISIKSTAAEFDGDSGDKKPTLPSNIPQITLKEKINLLNRE